MALGSTCPTLYKHINDLTREIEELKRQISKEEDISKGVNEAIEKKSDMISSFQEKTVELERAVKHNHGIYVRQKQVFERLQSNVALMQEQLDSKKADLQRKKDDAAAFRAACEEKLRAHEQTFQQYMEVYLKLPGVQEHVNAQKRLNESQALLKSTTDAYNAKVKQLEERKKMLECKKNEAFPSLTAWGVALAHKYKDYMEHKRRMSELSAEIEERKKRVKDLERKLEEKEKKEAEDLKRQKKEREEKELERKRLADISMTVVAAETDESKAGNSAKLLTKSPNHGMSLPNISAKVASKSLKQYMPSVQFSRENSLTRSKSLSSLMKGSSGSGMKPSIISAPKSLQKWLSSQKKQNTKKTVEPMDHSKTETQIRTEPLQGKAQLSRCKDDADMGRNIGPKYLKQHIQNVVTPVPATPPKTPVQPMKPSDVFNFQDVVMSPEDNFKFSMHVIPETPSDSSKESIPRFLTTPLSSSGGFQEMFSSASATPSSTPTSQEFKFAVPSAPPPGRSTKSGHNKVVMSRSKLDSGSSGIFSSPFSSPKICDDNEENDAKSMFALNISDSGLGESGFSLFGGNSTGDSDPTDFMMFKDDDGDNKTSEFESMFSLPFPTE